MLVLLATFLYSVDRSIISQNTLLVLNVFQISLPAIPILLIVQCGQCKVTHKLNILQKLNEHSKQNSNCHRVSI